jgi:hypothetical protein
MRDLWAEAFAKLSEEDKKAVTVETSRERDAAESVLAVAEAQQEKCKGKEWSFKFKGSEIKVREVLGNIMKWVNKFEQFVDLIVSLDVSMHATVPWTIIKTVLEVNVNVAFSENKAKYVTVVRQ